MNFPIILTAHSYLRDGGENEKFSPFYTQFEFRIVVKERFRGLFQNIRTERGTADMGVKTL